MIWHNGNQLVSQPRDLGLVLAQRVEKNPDDPLVGRIYPVMPVRQRFIFWRERVRLSPSTT